MAHMQISSILEKVCDLAGPADAALWPLHATRAPAFPLPLWRLCLRSIPSALLLPSALNITPNPTGPVKGQGLSLHGHL